MKRRYGRDRIAVAELSDEGGAGLGLMDIALKSGEHLSFETLKVDDDRSYFVFQAKVVAS